MKVTDVRVTPYEQGNMKAFCNVTFDNALVIKGFKIVEGNNGNFVSWPQEKGKDGKYFDRVFPTSKELRNEIQNDILKRYESGDSNNNDNMPF